MEVGACPPSCSSPGLPHIREGDPILPNDEALVTPLSLSSDAQFIHWNKVETISWKVDSDKDKENRRW